MSQQAERHIGVRRRAARSGLTLAEIMLALSLLVVTLLALAGLQTSMLRGRQKNIAEVYAAKVAAALMVTIEAELADDITLDVSQERGPVPPEILMDTPYPFEYEVSQSFDGPPEDGLKDVSVTIFWTDKNGAQSRTIWSKFVES